MVNPTLAFILAIYFLSMAGIPPLSGFISKFFVFYSVIESNLLFLLVSLIIVSLVSAYYYIRPVKLLFFHSKNQPKFFAEIPYFAGLIIALIFYGNVFLILQPRLLVLLIETALSIV